jgi:hypothetical protein
MFKIKFKVDDQNEIFFNRDQNSNDSYLHELFA